MDRYRRQKLFTPLGDGGQRRLQTGKALVVGCGALGGSVANLLVRAGIGSVGLMDHDIVEVVNLHRQLLFNERDLGRRKVDAARDTLLAADSRADIETFPYRFDESTAPLVGRFDLLIDGTDNFPTRFLMNRTAIRYGKPFITAGVCGNAGQVFTVFPGQTPCLACLIPPTEAFREGEFAILSPIVQVIAAMETSEAIKILSGNENAVNRSLFVIDLWTNKTTPLEVARNKNCPVCGHRESEPHREPEPQS